VDQLVGPETNMQRYIPFVIVLVVLIALAAYFGPRIYRGWLFRRDCNAMLAAAQAGKLQGVIAAIDQAQQMQIGTLLHQYVPTDYDKSIKSLKLTRYEESETGKVWAYITARIEQGEGQGLYECRSRWSFDGKHWRWDFLDSYGAALSLDGNEQWIKLSDLVALAGQL
jgi:hypothetical protein